jgi:methionyl-tRNA formyltransferase
MLGRGRKAWRGPALPHRLFRALSAAKRSLRLGFAGTPEFAIPALEALVRSRHTVLGVFTQPDRPAGRGQSLQPSVVKQRAARLGLPVHQPVSFKTPEAAAMLRDLELDALVVVAYGLILPAAALALPRLGCFNIHGSLLPRWRGAAPIQRALLAGDAMTGVTIMRMEAGLDTGPMLMARAVPVGAADSAGTVHDQLAALGAQLIVEALDAAADGHAVEIPQPATGVTYANKIDKSEALIDWHGDAGGILRQVHAFNPWPIAETRWNGAQLRVWDAELVDEGGGQSPSTATAGRQPGSVVAATSGGVDVACGRGVLRLLKLQLAGRKPLAAAEFIKAQRLAGAIFANS